MYFPITQVKIDILDVNDSPPRFEFPSPYQMQITEDATVGAYLGLLRAHDADIGENATVVYEITHADIGKWMPGLPSKYLCFQKFCILEI